jgi:hypothetical protein
MNNQLLQATSENPVPAACYVRNAERNPELIEAQVRACRAYADAHGLSIADEHVSVDDGASGANFDRPGWQALQRSAAAGDPAFACVIVTEPSRVSRSADPNAHPTTLAEGRVAIRYVTGTDLTERPAVIPDQLLRAVERRRPASAPRHRGSGSAAGRDQNRKG